ncbi:MAG: hypothetical protein MUC59_10680 [Saprospiraceae bacterium]|nr:hypothetical protein [Saprospiraceae bacterium]
MKTCCSFVFAMIFCSAYGQNAWLDATKLNEYFEFDPVRYRVEVDNSTDVDEEKIMALVATYCPTAVEVTANGQRVNLDRCFQGNPFISLHNYAQSRFRNLLPANFNPSTVGAGQAESNSGQGGRSSSNLITNLADGLAIFLVKRTKEELNAAFFEGLRKKMEQEPTYQLLFPATYDLIYVIGAEIYNYNAYLETLRDGFLKDLKVLPSNVRQLSLDHQFVKKAEYQIVLEDLLTTTQMLFDAEKPLNILSFLADAASLQDSLRWKEIADGKTRHALQDVAMSLRTLQLFTQSLTLPDNSATNWVSPDEVSRRMRDISHVYLYLGLLWQQGEGLKFSNGRDFRQALGQLERMNQTPVSLRNFLVSLAQTGKQLEAAAKELLAGTTHSFSLNEEYFRFANLVFELIGQARSLRQQIVLPDWKIEPDGKPTSQPKSDAQTLQTDTLERKITTVLQQLFDLEFNVRQERFTLAVANLTRLLSELLNAEDFDGKFKKEFLRHANFMATVAEAQDSREVAAAIELFALPPGSSRMKKQSEWSVSLNSYGGIAFGKENDFNDEVAEMVDKKGVLSPSAPLGICLNKGLGNAGSLSLYSQLIDVGALFAYRFSDQTSQVPELKFQNIVAPGGYLIYGFGNNLPISIGVGAQLGPNLRKVDPSLMLDVETTNAWRLGAVLSVDIPITHFYTR